MYASQVTKLGAAAHGVVNPLTTRGTILAAGPTGVLGLGLGLGLG